MIGYEALSFGITILLYYAVALHEATTTNLTVQELECKITTMNSHLAVASEMMAMVRRELSIDVKNICNKSTPAAKPVDCSDIYLNGNREDGVYQIWPQSRITKGPLTAYCHMSSDGGGWTVIQRRGDFDSPQDYFYQDWNTYKAGFGDIRKDFWIGNDNLFALTNQRAYQINFYLADWENNATYAIYDEFWIDDELHNYTLHVKGYRGTAGDSFTQQNGGKFSTKDKDNDTYEKNCAEIFKGAWWYTNCHSANLNGYYLKGKHESYADGVEWSSFRGQYYSLKHTNMKIRPLNFLNELTLSRDQQ